MGFSSTLSSAAVKVAEAISGVKANLIIKGGKTEQLAVQFNPSDYKITEHSVYSVEPRRKEDEPVVNFVGKQLATLSVKLYFDCDSLTSISSVASDAIGTLTGSGDSGKKFIESINKIKSLTVIDGETHMPPGVIFAWGATQFAGYAESVAVTYTMFDKQGMPLRAVIDLTLKGIDGSATPKKSPFMSPDRTKARSMTEDSNIWQIAEKEYGDVREWRRIADANGIMNPLDIPVGKVLRVPAIDDR